MSNTPVILITYKRPWHTEQVLNALRHHNIQDLYIFSDGPKNEDDLSGIYETRLLFQKIDWTKPTIIEQDRNIGLAKSIVSAVNHVFQKHDRLILLEDDCVPQQYFFDFIEKTLNKYKDSEKVFGISGYTVSLPEAILEGYPYDCYFFPRIGSWGWATWKRAWKHFEYDLGTAYKKAVEKKIDISQGGTDIPIAIKNMLNGKLQDVWTLHWILTTYLNEGYYIYPSLSHIDNIGMDGTGVHCGETQQFATKIAESPPSRLPDNLFIDNKIYRNFRKYYDISQDLSNESSSTKKLIKIIHICALDSGGAGKAAYRLHKGLQSAGFESTMIVLSKISKDPSVKVFPINYSGKPVSCDSPEQFNSPVFKRELIKWDELLKKHPCRPEGLEMFTDSTSETKLELIKEIDEADIINLHWISGIVNWETASLAFGNKPVVWTLHDMNPFTGGCHYSGDCEKFKTSCGSCPQLGSNSDYDLSTYIWQQKLDAYRTLDINIVTPSKWLAEQAKQSKLFSAFPVTRIAYGFPLNIYKPYQRSEIRKSLDIPESAKVILFGAESVTNKRKGFQFLIEALKALPGKSSHKYCLAVFGHLPDEFIPDVRYPVKKLGSISKEETLAAIYSMADVFIIPSLEDNLPNTVVESMACGTPVVGFEIGGIPDMIEHKKTGYLVKPKDISGLVEGIEWIMSEHEKKTDFSSICRKKVEKEFGEEIQSKEYIELYERLLNQQLQPAKEPLIENLIQEGEKNFEEGNYQTALDLFEKGLSITPGNATIHNDLGVLYYHTGDEDKALFHYNKAVKIYPENITFQKNMADFYFMVLGRIEDALKCYINVLSSNPEDIETLLALGKIAESQQKPDDAIDFYKRILEIDPENSDVRRTLEVLINTVQTGVNIEQSKSHENENQSNRKSTGNIDSSIKWPRISIVTPSFNQDRFLEECIVSILSQNYPNLEYIIMDGGSTDNSVDIIKKYEKHLTYWQSKPDNGQYDAINEGFKKSGGEIMTWLNSDDKLFPHALATVATIFMIKEEVDWMTGRPNILNEKGEQKLIFAQLPLWSRDKYLNKDYKYIQQEGTFWRSTLWEKAGSTLQTDLDLAGDLELWVRFFRYSQLFIIDTLLAGYRTHPNQKAQLQIKEYEAEAEKVLDKEIALFEQEDRTSLLSAPEPVSKEEINKILSMSFESENKEAAFQNRNGEAFFVQGNLEGAKKAFLKAIDLDPGFALPHSNLGVLYATLGDREKAVEHYKKAIELNPLDLNFMNNLANFYYNTGEETGKGIHIYTDVIRENPNDLDALIALGQISLENGRFEEAKIFYSRVLDVEPGNNEARDFIEKGVQKNGVEKIVPAGTNIQQNSSSDSYFNFPRHEIQGLVRKEAKRVLDIGCGAGTLGKALKDRQDCSVTGIEYLPEVAAKAHLILDKVFTGNALKIIDEIESKSFDTVIMADFIEHISTPEIMLEKVKNVLSPGGRLILSVPNIRHWSVVKDLLEGKWEYTDAGILDKTDLRFFTLQSMKTILDQSGYEIESCRGTTIKSDNVPEGFSKACQQFGINTDTLNEEGQIYQYLFVCVDKEYKQNISNINQNAIKGENLFTEGRFEEARDLFFKALEVDTDVALYHNNLGVTFISLGDKEKALNHYEKAVQLQPDNIIFRKNLADFYYAVSGAINKAIKIYTNIIDENPEDVETLFALGQISIDTKRLDETKIFFKKVLEVEPDHVNAREKILELEREEISDIIKTDLPVHGIKSDNNVVPNQYLISAIVSTYNSEKFIKGCLESLENQTIAEKIEIIVVNSGSKQNEEKIVIDFQKRYSNIKYIRTKERESVYAAWNRGIKSATGKYITNSNSDDRHNRSAFEVLAKTLEANLDKVLAYADMIITETENEIFDSCTPVDYFRFLDWDRKNLLDGICFMGSQPMWRKSVHDEYGYFDGSFITSGDYEFWLRISQTDNFIHIPVLLGLYLKSPNSLEHSNREKQRDENSLILQIYSDAKKTGDIVRRNFHGLEEPQSSYTGQKSDQTPDITQKNLIDNAKKEADESNNSSIIIVPSGKQIKECINNIQKFTIEPYEVIIINNNLNSTSLKWLKSQVKKDKNFEIKNIGNNENLISVINNAVKKSTGRYVSIISDTAIVTGRWLSGLHECFETMSDVAMAGPMTSNTRGRQLAESSDKLSINEANDFATSFMEANRGRQIETDKLAHFCFTFEQRLIEKIGLFDDKLDSFEIVVEDYCLRARLAGLKNIIAGDVFIHKYEEDSFAEKRKIFDLKWRDPDLDESIAKKLFVLKTVDEAKRLNHMGELGKAVNKYLSAIGKMSDDESLYFGLSKMLLDAKQYKGAIDAISTLPSGKDDITTWLLTGYCKEGLEQHDEAEKFITMTLEKEPESARAINLKGIISYNLKNNEEAESFFRRAIESDPSYGEPYSNLGVIKWLAGSKDEALNFMKKAVTLSPISSDIVSSYHAALSDIGDFKSIVHDFGQIKILFPWNKQVTFLLIDALIQQGKYEPAIKVIEDAVTKFGVEDDMLSAAIAVRNKIKTKEIILKKKGTISVCMIVKNEEEFLAKCLSFLKPVTDELVVVDTGSTDRTKAIASLFGATIYDYTWNDDFSDARNFSLSKAKCEWILVMDADEVISPRDYEQLKEITRKVSSKPVAYSFVSRNYTTLTNPVGWTANDGKYQNEEVSMGWVPSIKVRLFKNDPKIRFKYPVHEVVEPSIKKAGISIKKCSIPVHHYGKLNEKADDKKGEIYYEIGKQKLAEMGDDPAAVRELAIQAGKLEKHEESIELWERYLKLDPGLPEAYVNISHEYMQLDNYADALINAKKAIGIAPKMKEAGLNYSTCKLYMGEVEESISVLEEIINIDPDYLSGQFKLAAAYCCGGLKEEGINLFNKLKSQENIQSAGLAIACHAIAKKLLRANKKDYVVLLLESAIEADIADKDVLTLFSECNKREKSSL